MIPFYSEWTFHVRVGGAVRLMAVPDGAFVSVSGEPRLQPIPDRDRIFADEESTGQLRAAGLAFREVGVCTLKGFTGFHRAFQLMAPAFDLHQESAPSACQPIPTQEIR